MSNIVLVGIPGSGKTTVGSLLSSALGVHFFDSDQVIEAKSGKTVPEIFTNDGEAAFRKLEAETVAELLQNDNEVIALGGGSLLNEQTRSLVKGNTVIWLTATLAQTVNRVGLARNRPLLLGNVRGQLSTLMQDREPLYEEVASFKIDTTDLLPNQVVETILAQLKVGEPEQ